MNYGLTTTALNNTDCLVLGVFADMTTADLPASIPSSAHALISRLMKKVEEPGDCVWQTDFDHHSLLIVHCGKKEDYTICQLNKYIGNVMVELLKLRVVSATVALPLLADKSPDWQLQYLLLQFETARYQVLDFKTQKKNPNRLESLLFLVPGSQEKTIKVAQAIADGVHLTRSLADLPANICTPTYLAEQAVALAKTHPAIKTRVFEKEDMQKWGMGAFLSVAKGSQEPPKLIELQYHGADSKERPVVLVGKGITFDSGGISLKPALHMEEMKYDMAGAASVLGTLKACAILKLPINVVGLLAAAENMPSGAASKPGDIVTSMSGQTVEIINTDAEGRLVLADTLTYAERFKPQLVLDIATLTGAIIIALGNYITGFMTPDNEVATWIAAAAEQSEDSVWRLPLDERFQETIESPLADVMNSTYDRVAGSITAGCFLSRFTKHFRWAHLDIAGTAWVPGRLRNATGRPVPLLIQLLRNLSHAD